MNKSRLIKLHPTTPIPPQETQIGKTHACHFSSSSYIPWPYDSSLSKFQVPSNFRMDSNINKPIDYFIFSSRRKVFVKEAVCFCKETISIEKRRRNHHQRNSAEGCCVISDGRRNLDSETGLAPVSSLGVVSEYSVSIYRNFQQSV